MYRFRVFIVFSSVAQDLINQIVGGKFYGCAKMQNLIFAERPELKGKIHMAYCPERVLPGNVMYELVHNDRVIGGINEESTKKQELAGNKQEYVRNNK